MNRYRIEFFVVVLFINLLLLSGVEKQSSPRWYKGSLHTHSLWSDGDAFPEMVAEWYKLHGFHFVAVSDHNSVQQKEKWVNVSKTPALLRAFEAYQSKVGKDWLECKKDTGGVQVKLKTINEYKPLFEEKDQFLIIPSEEISDRLEGRPIHLNAINLQELVRPQKGKSVADVLQRNMDAVISQGEERNAPVLVQINHPNYKYALTVEDITVLKNARFMEIHNGYSPNNNEGDSIHPGTEEMWDQINIAFLKQGKPLLYGVASDDSHHFQIFDNGKANPGRGWVMVQADRLTPGSLIEGMLKGHFYASTGVTLKEIGFRNKQLKISVEAEPGVQYRIQFIGYRVHDKETTILKEKTGSEAVFKLTNEVLFVRAKIISDKLKENPTVEGECEVAWSQPVTEKKFNLVYLQK